MGKRFPLALVGDKMNRLHRWYCQSNRWRHRLGTEILPWSLKVVDLGGEVLALGPGPGLTTDWLRSQCRHLTCLELDLNLVRSLRVRNADSNVKVQVGDVTAMPFHDRTFSVVLSFTMLHHIPSPALQDRLFCEAFRVLKPGGTFAGSDSVWSAWMQLFHLPTRWLLSIQCDCREGLKRQASKMWVLKQAGEGSDFGRSVRYPSPPALTPLRGSRAPTASLGGIACSN